MHQPQVRGWWRITKKKNRNKKFKRISKRNLPNVGMAGWMDALTDKVHKIYSDFVDYRFIDLWFVCTLNTRTLYSWLTKPKTLKLNAKSGSGAPQNPPPPTICGWHARWHNFSFHCYLCMDGCVKCRNVVECVLCVRLVFGLSTRDLSIIFALRLLQSQMV